MIADIGEPDVADALAGADVVFNVAGQVSHIESMRDPVRDLELNVRSHLRFLETLRRTAPTAMVVQTSTRQVYGRPQYLPVDELHPTRPVDVNGVDKLGLRAAPPACTPTRTTCGRRPCASRTSTGPASTSP